MASMLSLMMLLVVAVAAWIRAIVRRLLLGPLLPSWSWSTELSVASARAVIARASEHPNPLVTRIGLRMTVPLPPTLRSRVEVRRVRLGGVEADRYLPADPKSPELTILYFHGGGYVFGNPGTHRQLIARLAASARVNALAPVYRLAPSARYPAAVDDAEAAYRVLLARGLDPESIILAGDSAGGGLAAALVVRIRSEALPMPGGLMMFSPYLDLTHGSYTIRTNAATDYLPAGSMRTPNDVYADADLLDHPEVSPITADLEGFPPALIFAGGAEMLLGDSLRFAEEAESAGVDITLEVEDEMMHVWPAFADWEPAAARTFDTADAWLDDRRDVRART